MSEQQIQFCKSADGTRLAVATVGRRSHHPLLLLLSLGGDIGSPHWEDFFSELASRRYLVSHDRRGSGASERDIVKLDLETELADITAVADCLGLTSFDLWGNHEAAGLTLAFAATNPGRVSRLILWDGFRYGRPYRLVQGRRESR